MVSVAKDVFISLPANWVGCRREDRGVYSEGRDLFLCELSKNASFSTKSIALQHLILGKMTRCHSLKDASCQLIQPNRKCAVLSTVRAVLGEKKYILFGTQEATHLMFLAAETLLGWNK